MKDVMKLWVYKTGVMVGYILGKLGIKVKEEVK